MLRLLVAVVSAVAALSLQCFAGPDSVHFTVRNEVLNPVDSRLFGHFLERASFGEPGYAALRLDSAGSLPSKVVAIFETMRIPVIRFPAGGDMPKIDWRDMIDNVPGRAGPRPAFQPDSTREPLSNAFGIDEFLGLCERLGSEPILVVNFYDALSGKRTLEDAARLAAGLVAYCNAPVGADLPKGMPDWPAVRAKNGRAEPWGIRYFHIGNEIFGYWTGALYKKGIRKDSARTHVDWYLECLFTYIDRMKGIDSTIALLTDANVATKTTPGGDEMIHGDERWANGPFLKVIHSYRPMAIEEIRKDGTTIDPDSLCDEEVWNAWVATPSILGGVSRMDTELWDSARKRRWNVAVTEWNWNGWWALGKSAAGRMPSFRQAQGVGAAGWLHAFMREGHLVKLACQSMLVGINWGITSVRVDPSNTAEPYLLPTGMVTALYANHHGPKRLAVEASGVPFFGQPFTMGGIEPADSVHLVDAVATADESTVFFHVINRGFDDDIPVHLAFSGFDGTFSEGTIYTVREQCRGGGARKSVSRVDTAAVRIRGGAGTAVLPRGSVSVIRVPLQAE